MPLRKDFTVKAKGLFDRNPDATRYYFTSDTQVFEKLNFAEFHASHLKDKTITPVYRPEMSEAGIKTFEDAETLADETKRAAIVGRIWKDLQNSPNYNYSS